MTQEERDMVVKAVEHCHKCAYHRSHWPTENGPCDFDGPCYIGRGYESGEDCDDFNEAPK